MYNDSIIIFSTDNGGPAAGFDLNMASNFPLRGVKNTLWEGGNVACVVWPSRGGEGEWGEGMWLMILLGVSSFSSHEKEAGFIGSTIICYLSK